jgi:hypothetical protein
MPDTGTPARPERTGTELIRALAQLFSGKPDLVNMATWLDIPGRDGEIVNAEDVRAIAEDDGAHWCGTEGCLAGWAAVLSNEPGLLIDLALSGLPMVLRADGSETFISRYAEERMGITAEMGTYLFARSGSYAMTPALEVLALNPGMTPAELIGLLPS